MLMVRLHTIIFLLVGLILPRYTQGQDKCGTVEYEMLLHRNTLQKEAQFEDWVRKKINEKRLRSFQTQGIQSGTYVVPVVVHIIHNGTSDATNISDAQILSQIQVLNDDYKRLNADQTNTPSEFVPFAGVFNIEFVLAKQNPEGLSSNGITRRQGTKATWGMADNAELKALDYWPAENYLNIWVANLAAPLIGYAQLPLSSQLPGLEASSQDRLTDGVAIHYKAFGTSAAGNFALDPQYNKGRTATHEVGHFFGLRHIWGDGSSCNTDYVDDTPPQSSSTNGCPSNPQNSCTGHKMFQNYLDYSNDICMNIFTQGQVDRMTVIIQNSPRRASLLVSPGATDPVPVANDLGIKQIVNPVSAQCTNPFVPQVEVRNYGNNTINTTQIVLTVDGVTQETKTFTSLNLGPVQTAMLSFNTIGFSPSSAHQVSYQINQTNGVTDGFPANNLLTVQVDVPANIALPFSEPFNSLPSDWQVINPDNSITWANIVAPDGDASNKAMYMNLNNYENVGNLDWLVTPAFSISNPLTSQVRFDLAYAVFPGEFNDELKVYALPGCNTDLSQAILLYDNFGTSLATSNSTFNPFVPTTASQWKKPELRSLSSLTPGPKWQLAFVVKNGYGNNLFIDNVVVSDQEINDLALTEITSPGIVACKPSPAIRFKVTNLSTSVITSFKATTTINGGPTVTQDFNNISLGVGEQKQFTLPEYGLSTGENTISLAINLPNGLPDSQPSNNSRTFNTIRDATTDTSPLRQNFDDPLQTPWIIASPAANAKAWVPVETNKNQSISYRAYSNSTLDEESWIVSPVLDMTRYSSNTLFFDLGYAQNIPADDRLRILGSTDCGLTYPIVLFDRAGSEFSVASSTLDWVPVTDADWKREHISLDSLSGMKNTRIAIVATNGHGNNIYVDNIEIFAGNDPNPPVTSVPYQLYYSNMNAKSDIAMTFNLPEKQDVRLQIYSITGQIVADNILPETLNQTYYFDLSIQSTGLYLFRVLIGNELSTTKVYIAH